MTAIESEPSLAAAARQIVAANGLAGVVEVLHAKSLDVTPEQMGGRARRVARRFLARRWLRFASCARRYASLLHASLACAPLHTLLDAPLDARRRADILVSEVVDALLGEAGLELVLARFISSSSAMHQRLIGRWSTTRCASPSSHRSDGRCFTTSTSQAGRSRRPPTRAA